MDPVTGALILAAGISIISGYFGNQANKEAAAAQRREMDKIFAEIDALSLPDIEKQNLHLKTGSQLSRKRNCFSGTNDYPKHTTHQIRSCPFGFFFLRAAR